MPIQIADNFKYSGAKPLDNRIQYPTVADMKAVSEADLYDGCQAYVTATKKRYTFDSSNEVDETYGKWREDSSGSGGVSDYSDLTGKPKINNVELSGNKTSFDLGLADSASIPTATSDLTNDSNFVSDADYVHTDNNYTTAEKEKLAGLDNYTLPTASDQTLGGVKVGTGLSIDQNGVLTTTGGGGGESSIVNGYAYTVPFNPTGVMDYINWIRNHTDKTILVPDETIFNGKTANCLYMVLGPTYAYLLFSEYPFNLKTYWLKRNSTMIFNSSRWTQDGSDHPGYNSNGTFSYANGITQAKAVTIGGSSEVDCDYLVDAEKQAQVFYSTNINFDSSNNAYAANEIPIENKMQFYSDSTHTTLITPETGKIYIDEVSGEMYEWNGTEYVKVGGTVDYNGVANKPKINNIELSGNKTAEQLGLVTKAVNDLVNYYLKTETYTKTEVDAIASAIKNTRFEVVSSLPTTNIKTNVIYLVPSSSVTTANVKDEYINLDGTTSGWELIGSTSVDLSGYVTDSELNTALADYTTTAALTLLLAAKQDANDKMTAEDMDDVISKVPAVRFFSQRFYITNPRWLRFDASNKKGLVILGGTSIRLSNGQYADFLADTHIDLSTDVTQAGKDYFVYINDNKEVHAYVSKQSSGTYIGRFHTLCVNAGTLTMKVPASPSSGLVAGGKYLAKPYREEDDPDFYAFYNKTISSVTEGAKYDVIVCPHPLSGYSAGDILPESVFCRTFKPNTMFEDAMVYDKATDIVVDIYLQSGTGLNTRSAYNQTHTVSREPYNHMGDMLTVGKRLLRDNEFTSIALGSNEGTNINGSADAITVGGHSDTNGRRMISAIGVEEACGYLYQWLQEVSSPGTGTQDNWDSETALSDGQGTFGKEYWTPYVAGAGGAWGRGAQCGSRCRVFLDRRSAVAASDGGRGSSQVKYF